MGSISKKHRSFGGKPIPGDFIFEGGYSGHKVNFDGSTGLEAWCKIGAAETQWSNYPLLSGPKTWDLFNSSVVLTPLYSKPATLLLKQT